MWIEYEGKLYNLDMAQTISAEKDYDCITPCIEIGYKGRTVYLRGMTEQEADAMICKIGYGLLNEMVYMSLDDELRACRAREAKHNEY